MSAQFNYCALIWMIQSRFINRRIKNLHKRCLPLVYSDKTSLYEEVLKKDGSVSIHYKTFNQTLAVEILKNDMLTAVVSDIFLL